MFSQTLFWAAFWNWLKTLVTLPLFQDASRSKSRRKSTSGFKSESDLDYGDEVKHDSYNDDSDLDSSAKVGDRSRINDDNRRNFSDDEDESKAVPSEGRARRNEVPAKRAASVAKSLGDLPKIVGRNLGLFTNSGKMASNYFDIVFKNRSTPSSNENVPPSSAKASGIDMYVKQEKIVKEEWDDDKTYEPYLSNNDDDRSIYQWWIVFVYINDISRFSTATRWLIHKKLLPENIIEDTVEEW